jgi:hypothetical protein
MRVLLVIMLLSATVGAQVASRVVVLANSIDSEKAADFYTYLGLHGLEPVKVDSKSFGIVKNSGHIVILGGQNSPEGVGEWVSKAISEKEREALLLPSASIAFVKKDVFANGQTVFVFAGHDSDDTRASWDAGKGLVLDSMSGGLLSDVSVSSPSTVLVEPRSNLLSFSFPINVSNGGAKGLSGLNVVAYLNGGIRLDTDPRVFDLAGMSSRRVQVRINPKNVTNGDTITAMIGGAKATTSLNVTAYDRANKPCNVCVGRGLP